MLSKVINGRTLILPVAVCLGMGAPVRAEIRRVSVSSSGVQAPVSSDHPSLSGDGGTVAFVTAAALAETDANAVGDVYVHGVASGETRLASAAADGTPGNAASDRPSLNADGKAIVFQSAADNLVPGDANAKRDIFYKDLTTGAVRIVSLSAANEPANGHSSLPRLSADGRHVVFVSEATNLVPGDGNEKNDVFVKDLDTGEVRAASADAKGVLGNGDGTFPDLSADGSFVTFSSSASNFVKLDTNGSRDVFWKNMTTGEVRRLSVSAAGQQGDTHSDGPSISGDGMTVVFSSESRFLVPDDTNDESDLFLRDLASGEIRRISVSATGEQGGGAAFTVAISTDGKVLAFDSDSVNLEPQDHPTYLPQIHAKDLTTGEVRLITVATDGSPGNGLSLSPALSTDGSVVAFYSDAPNLVAGDTNNKADIFVAATGMGGSVVPTPTPGDVNADASVDVRDAVLLLQFVVGIHAPTEAQKSSGDVKKDGELSVEDAVLILQHIVFGTPLE